MTPSNRPTRPRVRAMTRHELPPAVRAERPAVPTGVRLARLVYAAIPLGMVAVLVLGSFI